MCFNLFFSWGSWLAAHDLLGLPTKQGDTLCHHHLGSLDCGGLERDAKQSNVYVNESNSKEEQHRQVYTQIVFPLFSFSFCLLIW
jgi:hypothetical protein